ncbi:MAG TPA: DUF5062 family protein [Gammaproteobacteria bacterium]|nr:DUF5062 family protein [Gammaproteobacteria bacterium]
MDSAADKNAALGVLPIAALVHPCTSAASGIHAYRSTCTSMYIALHLPPAAPRQAHPTARDGGSAEFAGAKICQPLPEDQVSQQSMRHKLAIWYSKQLPKDHPLLN